MVPVEVKRRKSAGKGWGNWARFSQQAVFQMIICYYFLFSNTPCQFFSGVSAASATGMDKKNTIKNEQHNNQTTALLSNETRDTPAPIPDAHGKETWLQFLLEIVVYTTTVLGSIAYQVHKMLKSKPTITTGSAGTGGGYHQVAASSKDVDAELPRTSEDEMIELTGVNKTVNAEYGEVYEDDEEPGFKDSTQPPN